ncbi:NAD(P)H-dependent oxidoreductase [Demequina maris]|uniref:NAD(P)H-dependent oxidoreductase n=1 Tax=Demequina maris TaxID=1638982 RepID=UPI0007805B6A|nr:NAD(P)H-dependent oxidoreductase [Demequina maris]
MSTIAVVIGHPLPGTLTARLAHAYADAARAHADVEVLDLASHDFAASPAAPADLRAPAGDLAHLDDAVAAMVGTLRSADHLALFYPQWWGTYPAVFKAFVDRAFLSGVAYERRDRGATKLWTGKTARLTTTMDSPRWWNALVYRDAMISAMRHATLGYVGVRTIGVRRLPEVRRASDERRDRWIAQAARDGERDAERLAARRTTGATATAASS